jgi:hypothetical protein
MEKILAQWGRIFSEDLAEIGLKTFENELVLDQVKAAHEVLSLAP